MPKRRLTDADYERIAELRAKGHSCEWIGRKIGCSGSAVSWHCLRLGIDTPKPAPLRKDYYKRGPMKRGNFILRPYTPEDDAKLLDLEAKGLNYAELGRQLDRKPNSIRGRLMILARREERAAAGAA